MNTAARLQNAAPPGGLLVGEETHRLTRHAFGFEPIPPVDAKGKAVPVAAWSVVEPLEAPGSRPTSRHAARRAGSGARLLIRASGTGRWRTLARTW